jgi:hypothetical protein
MKQAYTIDNNTIMGPVFDTDLHGNPTGRRYTIGFADLYYTLWIVTTFNKVENVFYLQNLSMDFAKAQHRLVEITGCNDFEVDLELRGDSGRNFFRPLDAKRYEPSLLAISRFAGSDMRMLDANEVYHKEYDREGNETIKKMSGLLWATYLNKEEKTVRGLRRRINARECLVNAGILVKVGREYLTPDQIKKRQVKELRESAINGHHEENGKRLTLNIKRLGDIFTFETQYGNTAIVTYIDNDNRLFKYMGSNPPEIGEEFTKVKATIKHDAYKDLAETKLQRIKI